VNKKPAYHYFVLLGLLLLLAACNGQSEEGGVTTTAAPTQTAAPRPSATPTVAATATPTPTVEPLTPSISVTDQILRNDGQLTIDEIVLLERGWLVIQAADDGRAGVILATVALPVGEHRTVQATIDPMQATAELFATLHRDGGEPSVFEYPGPDQPISQDGTALSQPFAVDIRASRPALSVSDQEVAEDGIVLIDSVASPAAGFVGLHLDKDGRPGRLLGFAPFPAGTTENIAITINWREATPRLHAVLYADGGESGRFEPLEADRPLVVAGQPIITPFQVFLPPDMFILDQPVVDGTIVIERVISYGPGWAVVYRQEDEGVGTIIGSAFLEDGLNERVVVPVVASVATPVLYVFLHEDTGQPGEFGFPQSDPRVLYQGRVPNPFTFRINGGNYLVTRDQPLSASSTITVPLVVTDRDTWVVVYNDAAGEPGEIIGRSWVPAGVIRDTVVTIDPDLTTITLHVVLHVDGGTRQSFDFPDGPDVLLRRNGIAIRAPFLLFSGRSN
jgi:hypothetical protein